MRLSRCSLIGLGSLVLLSVAAAARAAETPDPLRLVPSQADLVVKVEKPGRVAEILTTHELLQQLYKLDVIQEQLNSTSARRFFQLVAYFEKELQTKWPEMLDRLAGHGIVVALKFEANPAPALLVLQGKDEKLLKRFIDLAVTVLEQELARQDTKDRVEKKSYRDLTTYQIGADFHAAAAGTALLVSNKEEVLHQSLDLHLDGSIRSVAGLVAVQDAKKLLPPEPLAWAWLNLETVNKLGKETLQALQDNPVIGAVIGHLLHIIRKSPYACAGLYEEKTGFFATIRLPAGRNVIPKHLADFQLPPEGQPGSLPPLEPKGVLFSASFHLNLKELWNHRAKFLTKEQLDQVEEFDKASASFLSGHKLSELLGMVGTHHRLVVVNQEKTPYKKQPGLRLPTFALVTTQKDPQFAKAAEAALRAGAIFIGTQVKLKLVEEKHGDITIVGYRFPEDAVVAQDAQNLRFNYTPCFASVGDQFMVCGTLELCHELIDLLQKEEKEGTRKKLLKSPGHTRLYGAGGAEILKAFEDQLYAQTVLSRGVPADEAQQEVQAIIDLVRQLGVLEMETTYGKREFHFDLRLKLKAK